MQLREVEGEEDAKELPKKMEDSCCLQANKDGADEENLNDAILKLLQSRLESCSSPLSRECCIYTVPPQLRAQNEADYTPKIISIGPIHHGRKGLEVMEEYKPRFLKDFLERTKVGETPGIQLISLDSYVTFIKHREMQLRNCYADPIGFSSEKFVEIMAVDVAFFMELLLKHDDDEVKSYCRIFKRPYKIFNILKDAMLLENQLPLFVLKDLFEFASIGEQKPNLTFIEFICAPIQSQLEIRSMGFNPLRVTVNEAEHFLDCVWIGCSSILGELPEAMPQLETISNPSMTELHQAGMKFEASGRHILDIECKDGVLSIPTMLLHDATRTLYKNLIALELCHYLTIPFFTDYFIFMNQLVRSPRDIDLLVDSGILSNELGDNVEAANAFHSLVRGLITAKKCRYDGIQEQLSRYYKISHSRGKAGLKWNCFKTQ